MSDIKVLNSAVIQRLGVIRFVLFDFDGTISLLREGWEGIMIPMMIELICDGSPPTTEIEREVRHYVDVSTGELTIRQMEWLAGAVRQYGLSRTPQSPAEYKALYIDKILGKVRCRVEMLEQGECTRDEMMVEGARQFLRGLVERGITLFLASGTDHPYVLQEAKVLGVDEYFTGGIYGALDENEAHDKARLIRRILDENRLHGDELLVVGDGPVEMREAVTVGAIALGLASDEVRRQGWNTHKYTRLEKAGADLIMADFTQPEQKLEFLHLTHNPGS